MKVRWKYKVVKREEWEDALHARRAAALDRDKAIAGARKAHNSAQEEIRRAADLMRDLRLIYMQLSHSHQHQSVEVSIRVTDEILLSGFRRDDVAVQAISYLVAQEFMKAKAKRS